MDPPGSDRLRGRGATLQLKSHRGQLSAFFLGLNFVSRNVRLRRSLAAMNSRRDEHNPGRHLRTRPILDPKRSDIGILLDGPPARCSPRALPALRHYGRSHGDHAAGRRSPPGRRRRRTAPARAVRYEQPTVQGNAAFRRDRDIDLFSHGTPIIHRDCNIKVRGLRRQTGAFSTSVYLRNFEIFSLSHPATGRGVARRFLDR